MKNLLQPVTKALHFIRNSAAGMAPFLRLLFALFLWTITSFSVLFLGDQLYHLATGHSLFEVDIQATSLTDEMRTRLKLLTLLQSMSFFVFPPFVIAWFFDDSSKHFLSLRKVQSPMVFLWATFLIMACIPLVNLLAELNQMIPSSFLPSSVDQSEQLIENLYQQLSYAPSALALIINIFIMALVPAVGEELMFRGVLQRMLTWCFKNPHAGIIIGAVIFGVIHNQFHSVLPRIALGMLLGYSLWMTGSIWVPVWMHFVNNLMNVLYLVLMDRGWELNSLEEAGTIHFHFWTSILSVIVVGVLLWKLSRYRKDYNAS